MVDAAEALDRSTRRSRSTSFSSSINRFSQMRKRVPGRARRSLSRINRVTQCDARGCADDGARLGELLVMEEFAVR
jgi:hypothetical protein